MTNLEQIPKLVEDEVQSEFDKEDVKLLNLIDAVIRELKGDGVSGKEFHLYTALELSKLQGTLARYKVPLAELIARSARMARVEQRKLDTRRALYRPEAIKRLEVKGVKVTENSIDGEITKMIFRYQVKWDFIQEFADRVIYTWRACNDNLNSITNRINVLLSEKSRLSMAEDSVEFDVEELLDKGELETDDWDQDSHLQD